MAETTLKRFDILEYVKKSHAIQMEQVIEIAISSAKEEFKSNELPTKEDIKSETQLVAGEVRETELRLKKEIGKTRIEIKNAEIKLMTLMGGQFIFMLGVLAKGFHWF